MQEIKDLSAYRRSLKPRILEAALKAFSQKGIRAAKMDDIARGLSISKRTIYEIYGDKEKLLLACILHDHKKRNDYMSRFAKTHNVMDIVIEAYRRNIDRLKDVNYLFYEDMQRYPAIMKILEDNHKHHQEFFIKFMERGVEEGYFRPQVNYEIIALLFDAIGNFIKRDGLYAKYPYDELFYNTMLVPLRGFCTEEGIKALDANL